MPTEFAWIAHDILHPSTDNPLSGLVMAIPGIAFMAQGVLIVAWPSVLPWLVAAACILAGGAMLLMAKFMRGVGDRLKRAGG